jgi:hypothetical protein
MRQQVFEFLRVAAPKLPVVLDTAVRRELAGRVAELIAAVWRKGRRQDDERSSGER